MPRDFEKRIVKLRAELHRRIMVAGGYDVVAAAIGCTREALYNLTTEKAKKPKRPSLEMAKAIESLLDMPMGDWADEYRFRPRQKVA